MSRPAPAPAAEGAAAPRGPVAAAAAPAVTAGRPSLDDAGLAGVVAEADGPAEALVLADGVAQLLEAAVGGLVVELGRPLEGRVRLGDETTDRHRAADVVVAGDLTTLGDDLLGEVGVGGFRRVDGLSAYLVVIVLRVGTLALLASPRYLAHERATGAIEDRDVPRYYSLVLWFLACLAAVPLVDSLGLVWVGLCWWGCMGGGCGGGSGGTVYAVQGAAPPGSGATGGGGPPAPPSGVCLGDLMVYALARVVVITGVWCLWPSP